MLSVVRILAGGDVTRCRFGLGGCRFQLLSDAIVVIFHRMGLSFPTERQDTSASASGSGIGLYGGFGIRGVGTFEIVKDLSLFVVRGY
jgi:hypothetical protein